MRLGKRETLVLACKGKIASAERPEVLFTESDLRTHVNEFAATISAQPLGLAQYLVEGWAQPTKCFENVARKVERDGGRVRFGYYGKRPSILSPLPNDPPPEA